MNAPINPFESNHPIEPKTTYRATQEECPQGSKIPDFMMEKIDFESKGKMNITYINAPEGKVFCVYSKPAWYVEGNRQFKIIDLMVTAPTEEEARVRFEQGAEQSEELRRASIHWVGEKILPVLDKIPEIVSVMGRGDVFDQNRLPNPLSDIDVMLFINFPSVNNEQKTALQQKLKEAFAKEDDAFFLTTLYSINEFGFSGGSDVLIPPKSEDDMRVGFDLISLPDVLNMVNRRSSDFLQHKVNKYAIHALLGGTILKDTPENSIKNLQELLNKKASR